MKTILALAATALLLLCNARVELPDTVWTNSNWPNLTYKVKFTNDSRYILTTGSYMSLHKWEAATGKLLKTLTGSSLGYSMDLSNDNRFIAFTDSQNIKVLDFVTWDTIRVLRNNDLFKGLSVNCSIVFTGDNKYLLASYVINQYPYNEGVIMMWDTKTWDLVKNHKVSDTYYNDLETSNDGKYFAKITQDSYEKKVNVSVLLTENWQLIGNYKIDSGINVKRMTFSPDNSILAFSANRMVYLIKLPDLKLIKTFQNSESVLSIKFSNDSKFLVIGGNDYNNWSVKTYDYIEDYIIHTYYPHYTAISIDISQDNKYIAVAASSQGIVVYNAKWAPSSVTDNPNIISNSTIYPNPTTTPANIEFELLNACETIINIYDNVGTLVQPVFMGFLESGQHRMSIEIECLASGAYFCRIDCCGKCETIKIVKE
ncbi:MAG: repeat-containing protein [Ignavibacteria bacterium]|nr:repeat-containing protein [Ignavibacteria bacterium]